MAKATPDSTSTELRAFEVFDRVPAGCRLHLIRDTYNAPHLRPGEFAVVDLNDRKFDHDEIFLIQWSTGSSDVRQVTAREHMGCDGKPFTGIWFGPLNRSRGAPGNIDWSGPRHMSDGPLNPEYLSEYLLGRVIGIYQASELQVEPRRQIGGGGQ